MIEETWALFQNFAKMVYKEPPPPPSPNTIRVNENFARIQVAMDVGESIYQKIVFWWTHSLSVFFRMIFNING